MSLFGKAGDFLDPAPSFDPEDEDFQDTKAFFESGRGAAADYQAPLGRSSLRVRQAAFPSLARGRYAGKVSSRKKVLNLVDEKSANEDSDFDDDGDTCFKAVSAVLDGSDCEDSEGEEDYNSEGQSDAVDNGDDEGVSEDEDEDEAWANKMMTCEGDDDGEEESDEEIDGKAHHKKETKQSHQKVVKAADDSLSYSLFDNLKSMSTGFGEEDREKGCAVRAQLGVWDSLLEARIRLQGALACSNQLPQADVLSNFSSAGGEQLEGLLQETCGSVRHLLGSLIHLQHSLLERNPDTESVTTAVSTKAATTSGQSTAENHRHSVVEQEEEDEDIDSDDLGDEGSLKEEQSEEEEEDDEDEEQGATSRRHRRRKRKRSFFMRNSTEFDHHLAKLHASLRPYRDKTISKWYDKTRLASGKLTSKAFTATDRSVLAQINQVMADKERLVRRTQLKRSNYNVLGKPVAEEDKKTERDSHLKQYDTEVFDDSDFYHQLLKELIEGRTNITATTDPIAMGRQWLEIQKLRSKVKKKVDTKASKGRKVRYDIHAKLVGFMAPEPCGTMEDIARNELFSSLWGKRFGAAQP